MKQQDKNHDVQDSIVYGTVTSRRFGTTLGINLLPANDKICNFNCIYCQLGSNEDFKHGKPITFPSVDQIAAALELSLTTLTNQNLTALVISGNGEPTLYPDFVAVCKLLSNYAKNMRCKLVLLSNGIGFNKTELLTSLQYIDECHIKWDAAHQIVNLDSHRPLNQQLLATIKNQTQLILQCCFLEGATSNTAAAQLDEWMDDIISIQPNRVDLYTISRTPAKANITALTTEKMLDIKNRLQQRGYLTTQVVS